MARTSITRVDTPPTPLPWGEPAYTIRIERLNLLGDKEIFEFGGYGLLRELLNDIETEAERRGWFQESDK